MKRMRRHCGATLSLLLFCLCPSVLGGCSADDFVAWADPKPAPRTFASLSPKSLSAAVRTNSVSQAYIEYEGIYAMAPSAGWRTDSITLFIEGDEVYEHPATITTDDFDALDLDWDDDSGTVYASGFDWDGGVGVVEISAGASAHAYEDDDGDGMPEDAREEHDGEYEEEYEGYDGADADALAYVPEPEPVDPHPYAGRMYTPPSRRADDHAEEDEDGDDDEDAVTVVYVPEPEPEPEPIDPRPHARRMYTPPSRRGDDGAASSGENVDGDERRRGGSASRRNQRPAQRELPPMANAEREVGTTGVRSMFEDLTTEMMQVMPDDFDKPAGEIPMTLREAAASVLRNNRTIRVAAHKPGQAKANIKDAESVYDLEAFADWTHSRTDSPPAMSISGMETPNREFRNDITRVGLNQRLPTGGVVRAYREWSQGTERNPGSTRTDGHGGAYVAEISQPLLNGFMDAENRTVIEISRIQADQSVEEFKKTVLETMSKAMEAYWNVVQAREEMRINLESLTMAEMLLERESGRKDEGIATQLDVNRAREAAASRAYSLMLSREQYTVAQENLKLYLNDKSVPIGMEVHIDAVERIEMPLMRPNMDRAIDVALANRPEMRNADMAIMASDLRRKYAKHTRLPEVNLTGSVRRSDDGTSTPTSGSASTYTGTDWSVGVGFSMPIGNTKAKANMERAESELSQNLEDKKNASDTIITEVRSVVKSMELIVREIPLNKRAMEAAAKVLEGEWAKLELNQTGNSDLLQAQDLCAVAERNYIQSLVRYNVQIVKLLAAQGTLLDRMGIKVGEWQSPLLR